MFTILMILPCRQAQSNVSKKDILISLHHKLSDKLLTLTIKYIPTLVAYNSHEDQFYVEY